MKRLLFLGTLLTLGAVAGATSLFGQTTINGATSGNWSSASSWSPMTVPNNNGSNTYNVNLLNSPAVTISLDINATIDTLTVDQGSTLQSSSSVSGTKLTTTGVTDSGDIIFSNNNTLTVNGAMTINNTGEVDLDDASTLTVTGNLTNSGDLFTNIENRGGPNTITVNGTFTNNAGANTTIGNFNDTADVMNVATLVNNGFLGIEKGATVNLTSQPNGVTDVGSGAELDVYGTLKAGTANGLAKLGSVEGTLVIGNGQTTADTPGSGTLTISSSGLLDLEGGSTLTITGNLTNSGQLYTNVRNQTVVSAPNILTVTGTFTNTAGSTTRIGDFNDTADVMNVATLVNNGFLAINSGATLNLTSQPNGVTDVGSGSELDVYGTLKAGTTNGLAKLGSVEGTLVIGNGQTTADTPGSGTLTVSSTGILDLEEGSTLTITGNLINFGQVFTNIRNQTVVSAPNILTVTGTFTNNAGANTTIGNFNDTADVMNVATLVNNGFLGIEKGATVNLTSQPNGVTDVGSGAELDVYGTLKAGTANGLAKLGSVEGTLVIGNGQTTADTPGSGTLTISSSGLLDLEGGSTLTITGNLTNSGQLYTNVRNQTVVSAPNILTVTGTFTNTAGSTTRIGDFNDTADVMNVATLVNNGFLAINSGATLNLTSQPNGVTDVGSGSELDVYGTLKAGTTNGLAKLGSVEGTLVIGNGQTTADTPGSGTLTVSSTGILDLEEGSTLTITGNLINFGQVFTNIRNQTVVSAPNILTVTGTFTNNATTTIGDFGDTADVMNVSTLSNSGSISVQEGATFEVTTAGTATNTGTITVGNNGGAGTFKIGGNVSLSGTNGKVVLTNFAGNVIEGTTATDVLTVAKGQTIEGSGNIGNNSMGLSNAGVIDADQSVPLIIQISSGSTNANSGTLEATNGATLQLDAGTYTQTSTGSIIASETGNALSTVLIENGSTIKSGKITITGTTAAVDLNSGTLTLNGVTLSGTGKMQLADGTTTTLLGTNSNTSTINLNSTGDTTEIVIGASAVALNGTGKVILSNNANNIITGASSSDVLTSTDTIEGSGNIGNGNMGFVNKGSVIADQSTQLTIDASSAGFSNQGTLTVDKDDTLYINNTSNQFLNFNSGTDTLSGGTYVVDGTLKFDGADILIDAANITLSGTTAKIVNQSNTNALTNLNTIASNGSFDITSGITFTTTGNFTNNGSLVVGATSKFIVNSADSLTNFNSGTDTLTGGSYNVTGTLEFAGADIVNNDASITLTGTKALIESTSLVNALTGFDNNESGATFALATKANFTTGSTFTNSGTLNVGAGSIFAVGTNGSGTLTNFSGSTLTGGTYIVAGTLEFNGANVVTNAANITLSGNAYAIKNGTGGNALASFATNSASGNFALTSSAKFTTAGAFSNAGGVNIAKASILTIGGTNNYTQTGGSTEVDGTLTLGTGAALNISAGDLFGNAGTITGSVNATGSALVDPGNGINAIGDIKITQNYSQSSSAVLDIDLGGTAANTGYDVLDVTDAASLNGTLNIALVAGFAPKVNATFTILNYGSETGTFSTVNLPTVAGDHWTVTYNAKDLVIKLVAGAGPTVFENTPLVASNKNGASGSTTAPTTVRANPARRVEPLLSAAITAGIAHEPSAILARAQTCGGFQTFASLTCMREAVSSFAAGRFMNVAASHGTIATVPHNNVAPSDLHNNVASVRMPHSNAVLARGGAFAPHEPTVSATSVACFYVCAYMPDELARTMGCR